MDRDEFNQPTKDALAERAGFRCSFPGCPAVTIGPSNESNLATASTGMACHIAAAASGKGARRYVKEMPSEQRSSIENGIWMCYTHGKLIDADETRFSIDMLLKWRDLAVLRAQVRHDHGSDANPSDIELMKLGFAHEQIVLTSLGNENQQIGDMLLYTGVPFVWDARLADATRDLLVEVARNAFTHGNAKVCTIRVEEKAICVEDNGTIFNWLDLNTSSSQGGGALAVKHIVESFGERLLFSSRRVGDVNQTVMAVARSQEDLQFVEPCCVHVSIEHVNKVKRGVLPPEIFSEETNTCKILYIVLPRYMSPSDSLTIDKAVKYRIPEGQQIVFVASNISSLVQGQLTKAFPGCQIVDLKIE